MSLLRTHPACAHVREFWKALDVQSTTSPSNVDETYGSASGTLWAPSPESPILKDNEVHVWLADLNVKVSDLQRLLQVLSPDERVRATRFYFQKDRDYFIVGRGLLRIILARYLETKPSDLQFSYSRYGKPALVSVSGGKDLCFNLSHSHGLALYAITYHRLLGIDIEHIRPEFATEQIAERFFSSHEISVLRRLPTHLQSEAFFNCWTRKEAYIKARGEGLSFPLDRFDVSLAPGEPAALLGTRGDPEEASRWSLQKLAPGVGYRAAVAVEGHGWQLKCWSWERRGEKDNSNSAEVRV